MIVSLRRHLFPQASKGVVVSTLTQGLVDTMSSQQEVPLSLEQDASGRIPVLLSGHG